ncbi:MAG: DUF169 domain-containing protein [Candidatus Hodarchaeota archaeon]
MNRFEKLKTSLDLRAEPVGVKLIYDFNKNVEIDNRFKETHSLEGYCQYVKRASNGEFLKIKRGDFLCKIANTVLSFERSENIELSMELDIKGLKYILLFPINKFELNDFDSIILIVNPRNCLIIIKTFVKLYRKPLKLTLGAVTGVCSEVTAHVIKREEVNFSFLCENSRMNVVFDDCELLCGIPAKMTKELIDGINNNILNNQKNVF